jgi:uncharacterized membrane protein SirB2
MLAIHILFALTSFVSFVGRVVLSELKSSLLTTKLFKIAPHVIDTGLLLSGMTLVIQRNWLVGEHYHWIISKLIILFVYVGLGVLTMRSAGVKRWGSFAGALVCYGYILSVAITKQSFLG